MFLKELKVYDEHKEYVRSKRSKSRIKDRYLWWGRKYRRTDYRSWKRRTKRIHQWEKGKYYTKHKYDNWYEYRKPADWIDNLVYRTKCSYDEAVQYIKDFSDKYPYRKCTELINTYDFDDIVTYIKNRKQKEKNEYIVLVIDPNKLEDVKKSIKPFVYLRDNEIVVRKYHTDVEFLIKSVTGGFVISLGYWWSNAFIDKRSATQEEANRAFRYERVLEKLNKL